MSQRLGILLLSLVLAGSAAAQGPAKPLKIIVGLPPSSSIDLIARTIAEAMAQDSGRPVIVENRTGAGGTIASDAVARSPADGQTLFIGGLDAVVFAYLMSNRKPLDPFKDLAPVGRITRDHWILAVSASLGADSVSELIALARSTPGGLTYASVGNGSSVHLQGERFRHAAGIKAIPVPYKDSYLPDLAAGRVSYVVHITAALAPHIRSGKLKGLAVMSRQRIPSLPELPTIVEAGLPDLVYNAGLVLYATGGTPRDVVTQLNRSLNRALANESVKQRFSELDLEPTPGSTEDAGKYIVENLALQENMRKLAFPQPP